MCKMYRRAGFTLIELLVVIAIITILVSLLLPGVQQSREAARRTQCANHLKQIGIALHNYHGSHSTFPPGWVDQNQGYVANWGWLAYLLPQLEQSALYSGLSVGELSLGQALTIPEHQQRMKTVLPLFRCPSDSGPDLNNITPLISDDLRAVDVATANYVGSNGGGNWSEGDDLLGVFGRNSNIEFRDITDGTSNTIVVGERLTRLQAGEGQFESCGAATVYGANSLCGPLQQETTLAQGNSGLNQSGANPCARPPAPLCRSSYSSQHIGGAQFLLGDGAVRFISENIQRNPAGTGDGDFIWQNLLNRADGNNIGEY